MYADHRLDVPMDTVLQIAVLFLPKGTVMPLHDHPGMTVFSKLLIGSAQVEGYDWIRRPRTFSTISGSRILAEKVLDRDVTPESGARVLFPDAGGNMHRFVAGEEMHCAFLDVLTPPYAPTERRRCTYHKDFPCNLCACKYSIAPCVKHVLNHRCGLMSVDACLVC